MYHNGCKSWCYKMLQVHSHNYGISSVMSWNKAGQNTTGSKIIICKVHPVNKRFVLFFFSSCMLSMYLDVPLKQRALVFVYRPPFVFFPPVNCWWWPLRKASRWVCLRGCDRPFSQQPFKAWNIWVATLVYNDTNKGFVSFSPQRVMLLPLFLVLIVKRKLDFKSSLDFMNCTCIYRRYLVIMVVCKKSVV